jgi:hypothetical protein
VPPPGRRVALNGRDARASTRKRRSLGEAELLRRCRNWTNAPGWRRAWRAAPSLDILVCNAGSGWLAPPGEKAASWGARAAPNLFFATNAQVFNSPSPRRAAASSACRLRIEALGALVMYPPPRRR